MKGTEGGTMKRSTLFIVVVCICAILAAYALMTVAQDKNAKPVQKKFIPSPVFSPPYPPLPHHFSDVKAISILCQAPKGAIKRALMQPLEPGGDGDLFTLLLGWTGDVEKGGYNVHEIAINTQVQWKGQTGNTTLIEYIDSDMGLLAGREPYGWPKKMADITWTQTATGWTITAKKLKDQGSVPLMKIEYKISQSVPAVKWPEMGPVLLIRRTANASPTTPAIGELVCLGCNAPKAKVSTPLVIPAGPKDTKGTATVQFFDGPHDPLTFFGPIKVLDAKMTVSEGAMPGGGLGLGEVIYKWEE
ncbi:MAG TPA: acetoacetate decarboxylase family protein [Acidobacteriota bacterium]|nr:acetoacetate decarboxylase family protein [Acidobacteriota bacterium]